MARSVSLLSAFILACLMTAFVADGPAADDGDVLVLVLTSTTRGKLASCG